MSSRFYRIGTIYSRVHGLIKKGAIAESDAPLWYDLYQRFPPKYEPSYGRPAPDMEVREIFYPEDKARAEIHRQFNRSLGIVNLQTKESTNCQRWIRTYNEYIEQGLSESDAIEKVIESIKSHFDKKRPVTTGVSAAETKS